MRLWPPFNQAEPGWEDGGGFIENAPPASQQQVQRGFVTIPKGADRVTVVLPTPIPLNTDYDIQVGTSNLASGDPQEQIYPTQLMSKNRDVTRELGFTYLLNAAPTTGTGVIGPAGENSYVQFNWVITYYA